MTLSTKIKSLHQLAEEYLSFANSFNWNLQPVGLYEPISYIMNQQGKTLRPQALLMFVNFTGKSLATGLKVAYAIELFHNFTLVHDDLMDRSETRRGKPTIHIKYGDAAAVLTGDAMMIYSLKMLTEYLRGPCSDQLIADIYKMALELCEGQQLDMSFESEQLVTMQEYLSMIRKKTSALLATSFKIGANLAGLDQHDRDMAYQLGEKLGLAFQIQDDWLDFYGNPEITGKQKGGDVLRCKKSILIIKALEKMNAMEQKEIISLYQQQMEAKVEIFENIFAQHQIREIVLNMFLSYKEECIQIIQSFHSLQETHRKQLLEYVNVVLYRNH
ncbi:MAG: polyprenyl synthetase family protein [Saprospiraceae bacterium]|nr:polyprenyl synthetase family protein [Saprospiraceae bacterium]